MDGVPATWPGRPGRTGEASCRSRTSLPAEAKRLPARMRRTGPCPQHSRQKPRNENQYFSGQRSNRQQGHRPGCQDSDWPDKRRNDHIGNQGVGRELGLQHDNHRAAEKLPGQRNSEPCRGPARHNPGRPLDQSLPDYHHAQRGQHRENKPIAFHDVLLLNGPASNLFRAYVQIWLRDESTYQSRCPLQRRETPDSDLIDWKSGPRFTARRMEPGIS